MSGYMAVTKDLGVIYGVGDAGGGGGDVATTTTTITTTTTTTTATTTTTTATTSTTTTTTTKHIFHFLQYARITCYPMQYVRFHLQHTAFSALLAVCKLSWLSSCACQVYMFVLLCIT